jgi:hypothetical protein
MAVTLHAINIQWELESFLLDIVAISKCETGENLAKIAEEILGKWNLNKKMLVACTTDTGKNIKKSVIVSWVYCMAHSLNLSVKKAIILKAKKICTFFHRSSKASSPLSDHQVRLGLKVLKMKMLVATR